MPNPVGQSIKHWYNNVLTKEEKKKVMNHAVKLAEERGLVLVGWAHELRPNMELPHEDHETDHQRRKREKKEEKIVNRCFAIASGEGHAEYLRNKMN